MIPCLGRSRETLQELILEPSGCWTRYHDLDSVLAQFPNLKGLTIDWFDFDRTDSVLRTVPDKLEALVLRVSSRLTSENTRLIRSMVPSPAPQPGLQGDDDDNNYDDGYAQDDEHLNFEYGDWSTIVPDESDILPSETDLSIPFVPRTKYSSVTLAPKIARLYDLLASFSSMKVFEVRWALYHTPEYSLEYAHGKPDVRGPLLNALIRQGLNRLALENMDLHWVDYSTRRSWPFEDWTDPKLKERGFVVTNVTSRPCTSIHYGNGEEKRKQRILAARAAKEQEELQQYYDEKHGPDFEYGLYKSRSTHQTQIEKEKRKEKGRHVVNQ